jgi:hypothetical protein
MAHCRQLESEKVEIVRHQLAEIIERFHRKQDAIKTAEIAEAFELHTIPGDVIQFARGQEVHSLLQRTGCWHHQVTSGGSPIAYVRSAASGAVRNEWSVQNFFVGPLAGKIHNAVTKLDAERADENIEVMLVTVPSYDLDFFLLRTDTATEIYLISTSSDGAGLIEGNFYSQEDFIEKLSGLPSAGLLTIDRQHRGSA